MGNVPFVPYTALMPLKTGQNLGRYRIERKIGEGGMGEVWAATDTRLNRPAAIKALPAALATDPERLARFKREAQLLAALSHPNIAGIYGLEQVDDVSYLAMELVEGDELADRIEGRSLPIDEAVEIALQIADALEEAHDKGIVHRDLKPANIKLTADGKVKVLDFGLAKALTGDADDGGVSPELSKSPTLTAAMGTQAGVILGTAAYMSPEQARGKPVDRRADIWAFGVILYEMLTGQRLYAGETATDVIAQVVTRDPDWRQLPPDTPSAVRRVLRRCLQKDSRKRLRDIRDAALELREGPDEEPAAAPAMAATPPSRRAAWVFAAAGLALGLVLATAIANALRPSIPEAPLTWTSLRPDPAPEFDFARFIELSPDGRRVVFAAPPSEGGKSMLWVRELGEDQARPLPGTDNAQQPFWSPDSRSVGFFAARKLRRVGIDGGVVTVVAPAGIAPRGGSWGADGTILYAPEWTEPLYRIPESGGSPEAVTELSKERMELSHRWPYLLPDGKHFLYYAVSTYPQVNPQNPAEVDRSGLFVASLDGGEPRLVHEVASRAAYSDGSLMYVADNVLTVRPFDLGSLSFTGDPIALVNGVTQSVNALWAGALFSVSDGGTLLLVRGAAEQRDRARLQWLDREGNERGTLGDPESYLGLRISRQGTHVATTVADPGDIWIHDLRRDTATRLTFDTGNDSSGVWSPDGKALAFQSSRLIPGQPFQPSNLFRKAASGQGSAEYLPMAERYAPVMEPSDWSPDGKVIAFTAVHPKTGVDIVIYSLEHEQAEPWLATEHSELSATFSPDGKWLAYSSDESGEPEIYVAAYPGPGGKWQVSRGGGQYPAWRGDGRKLFYMGADHVMAVEVETEEVFRHGTPAPLFELPEVLFIVEWLDRLFDATPDGERFLIATPWKDQNAERGVATLVQGWRGLVE